MAPPFWACFGRAPIDVDGRLRGGERLLAAAEVEERGDTRMIAAAGSCLPL